MVKMLKTKMMALKWSFRGHSRTASGLIFSKPFRFVCSTLGSIDLISSPRGSTLKAIFSFLAGSSKIMVGRVWTRLEGMSLRLNNGSLEPCSSEQGGPDPLPQGLALEMMLLLK